jgi:NTP pyrophosphatase (non-canonical NTP hydrolase)
MKNELEFSELRKANLERSKEWGVSPDAVKELLFRSNELGGESGEAQNAVKKMARSLMRMRGGVSAQEAREMIAEELADVIICADRVAELCDINLAEAVFRKFNKTSIKYGLKIRLKRKV